MEGDIQNRGFNHTFKWPGDLTGQYPGERARERTLAKSQSSPRFLGWAGKQDKPEPGLAELPPPSWHLPLPPSPEDQRHPRLQVCHFPYENRLQALQMVENPNATCTPVHLAGHTWVSFKTHKQPREARKPAGDCLMCLHVPVSANTVHPLC